MTRLSKIITLTLLGLCCKQKDQARNNSSTDNAPEYVNARFKTFNWTTKRICEIGQMEFIDIYSELDSISSDDYERLEVVEKLKSIGFTETDWGRGNWQLGPRIVSITLTNGQCDCEVDKLYYSTISKTKFKVTERIMCKPASR
jgi:hypothetical protein